MNTERLWKGVGEIVRDYVGRQLEPLRREPDAQCNALDDPHAFEYRGTWQPGTEYTRHQFCTYDDSVWCATMTTRQTPGGGSDWRLAVKKGGHRWDDAR